MWKTLGVTHENTVAVDGTDGEVLMTGLGLATIELVNSLVRECISDKERLECQWDAALLRVGEALREGDHDLAGARVGELPSVGLDHQGYESRKRELLAAYLQG